MSTFRNRKWLVLSMSMCLPALVSPAFAGNNSVTPGASKIALTDQQMEATIGAGSVEATMLSYPTGGGLAQALFVNGTTGELNYSLDAININGVVQETFESGVLGAGEALVVQGRPTLGGPGGANKQVRAHIWNAVLPTFESRDVVFASSTIDKDGDGIPNNVEIANGLNPNDAADAGLDPDRDFLSNLEEVMQTKTDPNVADEGLAPDTDGDGVVDKVELALGTDPNVSDSLGSDSADDKFTMHVINRLSYGPTSDLVQEVKLKTVPVWMGEQLTPIGLDEVPPDAGQVLRDGFVVRFFENMHRLGPLRPVHSQNQLQAKMAWFWNNHFSTAVQATKDSNAELWEEDQFFLNAFGNFKNLVRISAESPAMLRYLDLNANKVNAINENYAREVMELHTLGQTVSDPNAVYTAGDIFELARTLTGWRDFRGQGEVSRYDRWNGTELISLNLALFNIDLAANDTTDKIVLNTIFGGGRAEGERALDLLATHPQTARFICDKLAKYFISDNPTATTVSNCSATFLTNRDSSDQMARVLQTLFIQDEFEAESTQRAKFKDNQEYLFSLARFLGYKAEGTPEASTLLNRTALGERTAFMGQRMYTRGTPDGWPENGGAWINTSSALSRFTQGNQMVLEEGVGAQTISLVGYFTDLEITRPSDIIAHLLLLMLGGHYDENTVYLGYWVLELDSGGFALTDDDAEEKLEQLVARFAQLPEFNLY